MSGFHFIGNVLDVQLDLPVQISPDLRLERPDDNQLKLIHRFLETVTNFSNPRSYYERDWKRIDQAGGSWRTQSTPLEPANWRYYILAFADNGLAASKFQQAANVEDPPLTFFMHAYTVEPFGKGEQQGWGLEPFEANDCYFMSEPEKRDRLDATGLQRLIAAHTAVQQLDEARYPGISRALHVLQSLKRIPRHDQLRVLGLFSIIEMLLTHLPGDKEIGDSLGHQLKTKIELLSQRFSVPLDYSPFAPASPEKVWNALYAYRSHIAHGSHVDFSRGQLQLLRKPEIARDFLMVATRRLLRHALVEPALYDALKAV